MWSTYYGYIIPKSLYKTINNNSVMLNGIFSIPMREAGCNPLVKKYAVRIDDFQEKMGKALEQDVYIHRVSFYGRITALYSCDIYNEIDLSTYLYIADENYKSRYMGKKTGLYKLNNSYLDYTSDTYNDLYNHQVKGEYVNQIITFGDVEDLHNNGY